MTLKDRYEFLQAIVECHQLSYDLDRLLADKKRGQRSPQLSEQQSALVVNSIIELSVLDLYNKGFIVYEGRWEELERDARRERLTAVQTQNAPAIENEMRVYFGANTGLGIQILRPDIAQLIASNVVGVYQPTEVRPINIKDASFSHFYTGIPFTLIPIDGTPGARRTVQ